MGEGKGGRIHTVILAFRPICVVLADVEDGAFDGDEGWFVGGVSLRLPESAPKLSLFRLRRFVPCPHHHIVPARHML
jgi:hypothetical protein